MTQRTTWICAAIVISTALTGCCKGKDGGKSDEGGAESKNAAATRRKLSGVAADSYFLPNSNVTTAPATNGPHSASDTETTAASLQYARKIGTSAPVTARAL